MSQEASSLITQSTVAIDTKLTTFTVVNRSWQAAYTDIRCKAMSMRRFCGSFCEALVTMITYPGVMRASKLGCNNQSMTGRDY